MRITQVGSNDATGDPSWDARAELRRNTTRPYAFQFITRI
jgi:hypothetical protein